MKKLLALSAVTAVILFTGCSSKEEELMKMQDRNVNQMQKVNNAQQAELERLNKRVQELQKENMELKQQLDSAKMTESTESK